MVVEIWVVAQPWYTFRGIVGMINRVRLGQPNSAVHVFFHEDLAQRRKERKSIKKELAMLCWYAAMLRAVLWYRAMETLRAICLYRMLVIRVPLALWVVLQKERKGVYL